MFKLDYALSGPVPWLAEECRRATTVHLGGSFEQIAAAERIASGGGHSPRPYVLVAQQSLIDPTRAPAGHHTLWAYCHVPNGSDVDMSDAVEGQIERFAPGFRDLVLARAVRGPAEMEAENPNYIGGDINGGLGDLRQVLARPVPRDLALYDSQPPDLPVLLIDAPRRRRPRHVRLPRSPRGAVNNWCLAPIIHYGGAVGPNGPAYSLLTINRRGRR